MRARRPWIRIVTVAVAFASLPLAMVATETTAAETTAQVELPQPLTREAIRELVSRLSDTEVRELLLAQLDKAAAPGPDRASAPMATGLAGNMDRTRGELGAVLRAAPGLPAALGDAVRRFSEGRPSYQLLLVAVLFAVLLGLGWLVERLVGWLLGGVYDRLGRAGAEGSSLVVRTVLDLLLLAVFVVTIFAGFLALYQGHEPTRELVVSALLATVQVRLAILVARVLLAPRAPVQRLLPLDDATASAIYRSVVSLAWLYGIFDVLAFFLQRFGLPRESYLLVMTFARILFVVVLLQLLWRIRAPIARLIRGDGRSTLRRVVADLWPALMTAYVLGLIVVMTVEQLAGRVLRSRAGVLSLLVVIAMPLVDMALSRLLDRRAARARAGAGPEAPQAGFVPVLRQAIHIVVTVAGLLVIVHLWNLDLMGLAARGVGARAVGMLINIALTLLLAYLVWQFAKTAIDRRLEREAGPQGVSDLGEAGGTGASRLRTLLPLARGTIFAVVCVMSMMTVLAALGVNIGPLLAGAGVVGLAVGFGAQTLVRDIISGAFYLMDDAFRLGEYIDVGDAKGTVEKIGIRSMQLRHHRGPVNVVPYGAIRRMTNQSRDWVVEKLEFRLTYDTDIAKVKKIVKRIGQELAADPELGPHILQPLKSQGVLAMEDSALLVKAKFTAKPGEQFIIRREAYQRIKQAFDEAGIEFAHRQVTVFVPPGMTAPAGVAAAGGAAVAAAVSPEEPAR
ncbi:MAG TPA: mechanosensitive ion channel domain-containing protein [Methylomirabilota bacterium]|jgi:small-conductance mechanosensitive channel|nr:mechanosensitive ion channel domain-containing protein [Methylomirabilota bacterium]